MMLVFTIMSSCTASPRLDGIMDRDGARDSADVALMYKLLKNHFVQIRRTSITHRFLKNCIHCSLQLFRFWLCKGH